MLLSFEFEFSQLLCFRFNSTILPAYVCNATVINATVILNLCLSVGPYLQYSLCSP